LEFGRVTFGSSPSKDVNVLAIFRYVVKKIEVFSEGKIEKGIFCFRVCFRKINILVESWKSVEKRGKFVWELHRKRYLEFSRNVWIMAIYGFLPFSFQWLYGHTFLNRKSKINLIIFKTFFFWVSWRGFKQKHKPR